MRLQPPSEHPHGLPDREFDSLFTTDRPIVFAFHGYPMLIHRMGSPSISGMRIALSVDCASLPVLLPAAIRTTWDRRHWLPPGES